RLTMSLLRATTLLIILLGIQACGGSEPGPAKPPITAATTPAAPASSTPARTKAPPRADASLLARKLIFGNPERAQARLSPDGKQLAWLAPKDGVLNVFVSPVTDVTKARAVTDERVRPVPGFAWAYDNQHILYSIDKNGDENAHVYSVDVTKGGVKDLTPFEKIQGRLQELSDRFPTSVVVGINDRDAKYHDVYRV